MPKSRKNKERNKQLQNFKNKKKMNQENTRIPQMPEVRQVPVWANDAKIEMTGFEWEAIQNAIVYAQMGAQATQSVMSRNIMNGVIKMDFEKLNPQTLEYEPMTDEEKKPYQEEFQQAIINIKLAAEKRAQEILEQAKNVEVVKTPILNAEGDAVSLVSSEGVERIETEEPTSAKVVSMEASPSVNG